jgi:hypothetical protein
MTKFRPHRANGTATTTRFEHALLEGPIFSRYNREKESRESTLPG